MVEEPCSDRRGRCQRGKFPDVSTSRWRWRLAIEMAVIRRSMAEMKSCERGTAREEEPALALEEGVEHVLLERGQLARRGGGHGRASSAGRTKCQTSRSRASRSIFARS